ncbi:N/A [soil metagenome]
MFQEHALFPHLTVAGNIGFGVRDGSRGDRVAGMLDLVGLAGYGTRYPHELSGGERQRVALARALAPRPALLMLDEPFASLDPGLRARIRDDVAAILRSTGTPAVFVTHDQNEALAIGDRIAVMRSGRIVQIASPEAVFHTPVSRFVGAFMGDADFFDTPGALRGVDGIAPADLAGCDADTLVMLRPDDVTFTLGDQGSGVVTAAEFRGSTWCYTIRLASGAVLRSMRSHLDHVPVGTMVAPSLVPGHRPVLVPADPQP